MESVQDNKEIKEVKLQVPGKTYGKDHWCKIGGKPEAIQDTYSSFDSIPCKECNGKTVFYGQLSGIAGLPDTNFHDNGRVYVYFCPKHGFNCFADSY